MRRMVLMLILHDFESQAIQAVHTDQSAVGELDSVAVSNSTRAADAAAIFARDRCDRVILRLNDNIVFIHLPRPEEQTVLIMGTIWITIEA